MKLKIAILEGDGIGPEIMKQGVAVLDAIAAKYGHTFEYETAICGAHAIDEVGDPYPESTHEVCMRADAVLFAAVGDLRPAGTPRRYRGVVGVVHLRAGRARRLRKPRYLVARRRGVPPRRAVTPPCGKPL